MDHANSLLKFDGPAPFDRFAPADVTPAIESLLAQCRSSVEQVCAGAGEPDWDTVVEPIEAATQPLSRAWATVSHLNSVADTEALRVQYNENLPKLTAFWTELSQNLALYERYKRIAARPAFAQSPAARRRTVDNELRDFRLGGAELDEPSRRRLRELRERQSQVSTRFAENVLDATNAFALWMEPADLAGIPDDVIAHYRETAQAEGRDGCKLTLHAPSYVPAMQYAHDRSLRQQLYRAYSTRASEFGPPKWDNTGPMLELLRLRAEQAHQLGYGNYGELSLVPKMARTPGEVLDFLRDLSRRSKPQAQRDLQELREFAARDLGLADLQAWDIAYASEHLRQARYSYSDQELRPYFPIDRVLAGLFELIERLFGAAVRPDRAPVWHPDVRFYRIESRQGELLGQFYLDLYARPHKQGGAWQDDARSRWRHQGVLQTPVSFLTCNLSPPVAGKPALLTHDEVSTLLHEFGHGLHHLLTRIDEPQVSGIHGVEWDAVELPSQFLENFGWQWDALRKFSGHVDTGEPLPRELFDRVLAARNFQSGMHLARQIEFGLFDMRLHSELHAAAADAAAIMALLNDVRREVAVVFPPEDNRTAHSFMHIFSGGYSAGYYSYLWAEVLSADCFDAFEERPPDAYPALGRRFLDAVLAVGGSRPAIESFTEFRGRAPTLDALLRQHGIAP